MQLPRMDADIRIGVVVSKVSSFCSESKVPLGEVVTTEECDTWCLEPVEPCILLERWVVANNEPGVFIDVDAEVVTIGWFDVDAVVLITGLLEVDDDIAVVVGLLEVDTVVMIGLLEVDDIVAVVGSIDVDTVVMIGLPEVDDIVAVVGFIDVDTVIMIGLLDVNTAVD